MLNLNKNPLTIISKYIFDNLKEKYTELKFIFYENFAQLKTIEDFSIFFELNEIETRKIISDTQKNVELSFSLLIIVKDDESEKRANLRECAFSLSNYINENNFNSKYLSSAKIIESSIDDIDFDGYLMWKINFDINFIFDYELLEDD